MKKEDKNQLIDSLIEDIKGSNHFYLTDISGFNAVQTYELRKKCFENNITLRVVKNSLLQKALERTSSDYAELCSVLSGSTSVMFSEVGNAPAKLIKEMRRGTDKPILKGAFVEQGIYIGDDKVDALLTVKSREDLIGDIIGLLQSPAKNVISALQNNAGQKIAGIVKTLSER